MRRNIRLLAVSRMENGVCIAGIGEHNGRWLRPVRHFGSVSNQDVVAEGGVQIQPLDLVSFNLVKRSPDPPHVEDWIIAFSDTPQLEERPMPERIGSLLDAVSEPSPDEVVVDKSRSLVLIEPEKITEATFGTRVRGQYTARLSFRMNGRDYVGESQTPGFPCTDIRLRSWGRTVGGQCNFTDTEFRSALGVDRIFLVMGLSRPYQGACWPMVVGFHTVPDFEGVIDFDNP